MGAFLSRIQQSRIRALCIFFGQEGHRPPPPHKSEDPREPMFLASCEEETGKFIYFVVSYFFFCRSCIPKVNCAI